MAGNLQVFKHRRPGSVTDVTRGSDTVPLDADLEFVVYQDPASGSFAISATEGVYNSV